MKNERMISVKPLVLEKALRDAGLVRFATDSHVVELRALLDTPAPCAHEWTDDGGHLTVCTACGAQEDHDPGWRDMESAPKDGTLLRLLVSFDEHSTEDADEAPTIGANNFDNDGDDAWRFAGWCWSHDHFTQGIGTPVGWLPMIETSASTAKLDRITAERDALQQRLNAADQLNDHRAGTCEWSREEDSGIWNSGCGETWSFHEDGPEENGMHFCQSCGKHLVVEVAEQEQDEDWRMHPCKQGHRDVGAAGGVAACNLCGEKVEAATTQEAFEQWNASHQPAIEKPDSPFTEQFIEDHLGNPANSRSKP